MVKRKSLLHSCSCHYTYTFFLFFTAPPYVSAVIYGKNGIKVTWNQIQLDGWNSSNIVYQFTYYTREKRYITRETVQLPSDTTSYIVYVKDSIPELEHFFTVSCNLRVDGVIYYGLIGNTSFVFGEIFTKNHAL